jgi:hypothetical protein
VFVPCGQGGQVSGHGVDHHRRRGDRPPSTTHRCPASGVNCVAVDEDRDGSARRPGASGEHALRPAQPGQAGWPPRTLCGILAASPR